MRPTPGARPTPGVRPMPGARRPDARRPDAVRLDGDRSDGPRTDAIRFDAGSPTHRPGTGRPEYPRPDGSRLVGRRPEPRDATAHLRPPPQRGPDTAADPLVARRDPVGRGRHSGPPPGGRLSRFTRRYGWRAYAVPVLVVATFIAMLDVASTAPEPTDARTAATTDAGDVAVAAPAPDAAPTSEVPAPATAEGESGPLPAPPAVVATAGYVEQGAGTVSVVDGTSQVYGSGPLQRFVVEVEDGIQVDGPTFAAAVEATLADPRSWGNGGARSFQRVGAAEAAGRRYDFKVALVSPGSMETYCPGVGTGGYTSCRYGERAVINLARWQTAVPDYQGDVATYRQYVVNHEVGHALGNGHRPCPGPGQLAPVMQQQTLGLDGCAKNAWPFP